MDPFEVRMQFLTHLRRLNASQQSIQKVVSYALKYFSKCGEDLWDCIVEECQNGTINARINILYFLDSLCEASLLSKVATNSSDALYVNFATRDLEKIVEYVVPEGREGLINLMSAIQILDNWRTKRVIDPLVVERVLTKLDTQKDGMHAHPPPPSSSSLSSSLISTTINPSSERNVNTNFDRNEVFKRIEEDRERHKRLRERRWVQPVSSFDTTASSTGTIPMQLATFTPSPDDEDSDYMNITTATNTNDSGNNNTDSGGNTGTLDEGEPSPGAESVLGLGFGAGTGVEESVLDIEFENEWEATSDWNEDDEEAVLEENELCYPNAAIRLGLPRADVDP